MKLIKTAMFIGSAMSAIAAAKKLSGFDDVDSLLQAIGLSRRPSTLRRVAAPAAWIGLGAAVGAGTAVMLDPAIRENVIGRLGRVGKSVGRIGEGVAPGTRPSERPEAHRSSASPFSPGNRERPINDPRHAKS